MGWSRPVGPAPLPATLGGSAHTVPQGLLHPSDGAPTRTHPRRLDPVVTSAAQDVRDAIVVGAGFAGLYAVHVLRDDLGLDVIAFDAAGDVGGTWYWNRYPGARVDIESVNYSYSFDEDLQQEWHWSERFCAQPEILAYLNHVADRFDLRRSFRFNTRITALTWDDATSLWTATTDAGEHYRARYVV